MGTYRPGGQAGAPRNSRDYRDLDNRAPRGREYDFVAADDSEFRIMGHASRRSPSPRRERNRDDGRGYRERDVRYVRHADRDERVHTRLEYDDRYDPPPHFDEQPRFNDRPYEGQRPAAYHAHQDVYSDNTSSDPYAYSHPYQYADVEPEEPEAYYGENDVTTTDSESHLVLVRNLKKTVDEAMFAKGLDKLYQKDEHSKGATPGSLYRVLLIRDRETNQSMCFGFAEYHDTVNAQKALSRGRDLGVRCTIASTQVMLDTPHLYVFPPVVNTLHPVPDRFSFNIERTEQKHMYHDQRYYAAELIINPEFHHIPPQESIQAPQADQKSTIKARSKPKSTLEEKASSKDTKAKAPAGLASMFDKWQTQHTNIHKEQDQEEADKKRSTKPATGVNTVGAPIPDRSVQTFAKLNGDKGNCYLCARVFNDAVSLNAHIEKSELHATKRKDEKAVAAGYALMKVHGVSPEETIPHPAAVRDAEAMTKKAEQEALAPTPRYVDRAALRRQEEAEAGAQQSQPKFSLSLKGLAARGNQKRGSSATSNSNSAQSAALEEAAPGPTAGIGAKMLQRAGWTAGQGLGAEGSTGSAAAISMDMYAAGVGLGHAGGKIGDAVEEADRATKGDRGGFVEKTKDVARERYERMK